MLPGSVAGLLVVLVAVLPGAAYTWAFERQAGSFGVSFADRALRFIGSSMAFHLLLGPVEYVIYRVAIADRQDLAIGQFLLLWTTALVLFALPNASGSLLGGLYRSRSDRGGHWQWVRRHLSPEHEDRLLRFALGHDPAPRAWDHLFSDRTSTYIRVRLKDDTWVAGRFADRSYAGGYPNPTDLLLEDAWALDPETKDLLGDEGLGYPVYVAAGEIVWLERIPEVQGDGGNPVREEA